MAWRRNPESGAPWRSSGAGRSRTVSEPARPLFQNDSAAVAEGAFKPARTVKRSPCMRPTASAGKFNRTAMTCPSLAARAVAVAPKSD